MRNLYTQTRKWKWYMSIEARGLLSWFIHIAIRENMSVQEPYIKYIKFFGIELLNFLICFDTLAQYQMKFDSNFIGYYFSVDIFCEDFICYFYWLVT